jgi:ATP-dependent Lon protease
VADLTPLDSEQGDDSEIEAMRRAIVQQFDQYVKLNKKIPPEILASLSGIDDAGRLADTMAAHLPLKLEQKQVILEIFSVPSVWSICWASSKANSTSCRWKSASVAASSARWRRASASTT